MAIVEIHASKNYSVYIENGLLDRIGVLSTELFGARNAVLVTDDTVAPLYAERVINGLRDAGFGVQRIVLPAGEKTKSFAYLENVLQFFALTKLTRSDIVFALGGGVIGDLTGFASAVYLRGVRYVQIPTTLLAAVDSSVGGKTAIDLSEGKNLIGAFHQPSAVFCDPETLQTLPAETFADGCAEVIKYAVLDGEPLVSLLAQPEQADWCEIIRTCVQIKKRLVEEDEFDNGARMLLNLGHTFGHAIEQKSNFSVTHGKAVAIGTVIASKTACKEGLCESTLTEQITALFQKYNLPTVSPYACADLAKGMLSDKKRSGDNLRLVLPRAWGDCAIVDTDVHTLQERMASLDEGSAAE